MASSEKPSSASSSHWLFSVVGVVILFAILVAVNFIVKKAVPVKVDLTEDKLHTLAEGTREILSSLDTPVKLTYFASKDKENVPAGLTTFSKKIDALLDEYARGAKDGLLEIERVNPEPDSEEEDRAKLNGLESFRGRFGENVYLGITATCLERKTTIPLITPQREQMIEYDISRAIVEVTRSTAPKVAVMSAFPVGGSPSSPFAPAQGPPAWFFYNSMTRDYDPNPDEAGSNFSVMGMDVEAIPEDIEVVLLVHPAAISETTEFALDQFLLRGGRIVAFLDAFSVYAEATRPQQQPQFGGQPQPQGTPTSSDLPNLLPAWGIEFEANQVVADMGFQTMDFQGRQNPSVLQITKDGINGEDPVTRDMRELFLYAPGTFYVQKKDGLEVKTLIESTAKSQLVGTTLVNSDPGRVMQSFKESGKKQPLAIRVSGMFKTAFPEGKPKPAEAADGTDAAPEEDGEEEEYLKESQIESSVFLVADSDMLADVFGMVTTQRGQVIGYRNHNIPLVEGATEQATGGSMLTSIRARGTSTRPFNKFKELEADASDKYRKELAGLDDEAQSLNAKLAELMRQQGDNQMVVVSPEVQEEIKSFQEQQVATSKRRRELSRELRKDVTRIENRIKLLNIAGVPLLVVAIGLVHLIVRRQRMSAR